MTNAEMRFKSGLLWTMRSTLRDLGFIEVITPVVRRNDDLTGKRANVQLHGDKFLRSMIGPALRMNLEHSPRVFEIGPCFRTDGVDETHRAEFSMLDLYAANEDMDFLFDIAEQLVQPHVSGGFDRLSVAGALRDEFGVDLRSQPKELLQEPMAKSLGKPAGTRLLDLYDTYIEERLEPKSTGRNLFLVDYPEGGNEPCAARQPGTMNVLQRFELFVNGVEVVHGYEDEPDSEAFTLRAKEVDLYNEEQAIPQRAIAQGQVPANSVGLGIGIERLCMAATGIKDISRFQSSPMF